MARHRPHVERVWENDRALTVLLGLLVAMIFFLHPLVDMGYEVAPIGSAIFTLMLLSGIAAVTHSPRTRMAFGIVVVIALAVHWMRYVLPGPAWAGADAISSFVACGMLAAIIFLRVFRPGPITSDRIQGAIAAYLLIGIMFAAVYVWIELRSAGAFAGSAAPLAPAPGREGLSARFVYFSFTTLTTVGFGDIVPVQPFARSLATMEALIGQVFPAILLARLVSLEVGERQRHSA